MDRKPHTLTLTEAAALIRRRQLSCSELVESCLDAIDRLDTGLKAWVTVNSEGARREANQLDREAAGGHFRGPLHGVPVGIKDIFYTAGIKTTAGHAAMADFVPSYDCAVVERLKFAGAIILGKTATTEFAGLAPAETCNPWNSAHTPGGSSSGSAAAVAARMCPVAIGSQTAGSVLRPSGYCGVVGFKPTFGRISVYGVLPLAESSDHPGIIARAVADLAPMLQVLAGYDPRDHTSAQAPVDDYVRGIEMPVGRPRIAVMLTGEYYDRASAEVRENLSRTADRFSKAGATVEDIAPPTSLSAVMRTYRHILECEAASAHREEIESHPEGFRAQTRDFLRRGLATPVAAYIGARTAQREFRSEVAPILERFDAIMVPSSPSPAPRGLESTGDPVFNAPWSMSGHPVVGLPTALSTDGLPMAVQLVGASFGEARLLSLARWCEAIIDFAAIPSIVEG